MVFLITGTDTGVGKTFVTSKFVSSLKKRGVKVLGFKVIETGCKPQCEDSLTLSKVSEVIHKPVYFFKEPLAPAVAAEIEETEIYIEKILSKVKNLKTNYDITFIEGAGGLLVPIRWDFSFLDLAKTLSCEVIIVALNRLGVINHTLLTVKCCEYNEVKVRGIILNTIKAYDESVKTNLYALKKLLPHIPISLFRKDNVEKTLKDLSLI